MGHVTVGVWGIWALGDGYWGYRDGRCCSRAPSLRGACSTHALPRERRAVKGSSLSGEGGLCGDSPPGRRDSGPFSQGGRSLKKGSLYIGGRRRSFLRVQWGPCILLVMYIYMYRYIYSKGMKVCARSALELQLCISRFRASCMTWSHSERRDLGPGISYSLLSDLVHYSNPNPNPNPR